MLDADEAAAGKQIKGDQTQRNQETVLQRCRQTNGIDEGGGWRGLWSRVWVQEKRQGRNEGWS